jgi:hypothetical protein
MQKHYKRLHSDLYTVWVRGKRVLGTSTVRKAGFNVTEPLGDDIAITEEIPEYIWLFSKPKFIGSKLSVLFGILFIINRAVAKSSAQCLSRVSNATDIDSHLPECSFFQFFRFSVCTGLYGTVNLRMISDF